MTEEGKPPPPILTSHHILQRNNCKHPNNMVWKLQWFRPQGPAMPCKNSWENYWKLTLSHIRHLPQTVCEQDPEHHIRPHPSLQWTLCPVKKKKKAYLSTSANTERICNFFPPKGPQCPDTYFLLNEKELLHWDQLIKLAISDTPKFRIYFILAEILLEDRNRLLQWRVLTISVSISCTQHG